MKIKKKKLIKKTENSGLLKESNLPKYNNLREVMDYTKPLTIFFSGVENETYLDILYDLGIRNFLMSYEYLKGKGLKVFKKYSDIRLFIDSGAYTYQNDPKYEEYSTDYWEEHIQKYLSWVEKHKDSIFAIADLDLQYLRSVGYEKVYEWREKYFEPFMLNTGVPVCFVYHEDGLDYWNFMCKRYPYVGLSLAIDKVPNGSNILKDMFKIAEKHNALCQGMASTDTKMLVQYPFYTVDSTTWLAGLKYGELNVWNGTKMSRIKKSDFRTKAFPIISGYSRQFDFDLILAEDKTEMIKVNAYAFVEAERYVNERLKSKMYWFKKKTVKQDINNLSSDFFPSDSWFDSSQDDFAVYAERMNINAENRQTALDFIMDVTIFLNWDNEEYVKIKEQYVEEDYKIIKNLHNTFVNRIVASNEDRINDLIDFYASCVSGECDTLLQYGTNFDRIVKERDSYIEEENTEISEFTKEEVIDKVHDILRMDNLLTDGENNAPEVDSLDDEIFKKANIIPIRDNHGRLIKGQTTRRISKKIYSDKYPKFACDTCLVANNCSEYKSGYVCAYNKMFKRFDTRDMNDLIDIMYGMVEHNVGRMQMAMLQETLTGNVGDPKVTNFINQNINLVNTLINLKERQNSLTVKQTRTYSDGTYQEVTQVTNPQSGGILEKLFGNNKSENSDKKSDDKKAAIKDIVEV